MTRQRQLIYNIIQRADDHPTAEMIYARAKAEMPSIAFGTVYRNLKLTFPLPVSRTDTTRPFVRMNTCSVSNAAGLPTVTRVT